jgi:FkbM family methyltransferase
MLGPFGLSIDKTEKTNWIWSRSVIVTQVGRYFIDVPPINPVSTRYALRPDYSSQLGRLATIIRKKYPSLGVIDVGANVGDTACIIKTAENIPLLCIEGDEHVFGLLEKNLKQFQNVAAHRLFLGDKTGVLSARLEKKGWNTTIVPEKSKAAALLNIISLDDFLATQQRVETFKLLKIDAEGFDCAIIRGAKKYIQQALPVITFEYNRNNMKAIGETGRDTLFMLMDSGYSGIVLHDACGKYLCSAELSDSGLIRDLYDYVDDGVPYYHDVTIFHKTDNDIGSEFIEAERSLHRKTTFKYQKPSNV